MFKVYFIFNSMNSKAYAGMTVQSVRRRFQDHCNKARHGSNLHFHNALRKYGVEAFHIIKVWEGESKEEAITVEKRVIAEMDLRNRDRGYNNTEGGEGNLGWNPSPQTRERMRQAKTPAIRARLSALYTDRPIPQEQRLKIAASSLGKPISEETKVKHRSNIQARLRDSAGRLI